MAHVLFFGKVADSLGRSTSIAIPATGCSVAQLRDLIAARFDGATEALCERGVRAAVNQEMAGDEAWVRPGQEVAFFSMFSGG